MVKNIRLVKDKEIYRYGRRDYELADEIVKGGCQGCAFINKLDCAAQGRTKICTKKHKIFQLYLKALSNE